MFIVLILICLYFFFYFQRDRKMITNYINQPYSTYHGIPKIIFRTNKTRLVPKDMKLLCFDKWNRLNSSWNMFFYSEKNKELFMKRLGDRFYNAYDKLIPGSFKTDFWRICILYIYGGVYVDSYTEPFVSLNYMMKNAINKKNKHHLISIHDGKYGVHNGFIICTPRHPFLAQYIIDMLKNIETNFYGSHNLEVTGPKCFERSIQKVLNTDKSFNIGWNDYGELSFYLFKFGKGPSKFTFKENQLVLRKKYNLFEWFNQRVFQYDTSYITLWRNRNIYKRMGVFNVL